MNKDRILALSDGIIAIAATIMVLELSIPSSLTINSLLSLSPTLFAYIISFTLIYSAWRSHHNTFDKAEIITEQTFAINGIWIFFITMIPFATALIGNYPYNSLASCIYVSTIFLWTLTFQFLDISITNSNPGAPLDEMRENKNRLIIFGGYVLAFVIALFIPLLSIIIMGISTLIMALKIIMG